MEKGNRFVSLRSICSVLTINKLFSQEAVTSLTYGNEKLMSLCNGDLSALPVSTILKHCAVNLSISARYQVWRYQNPDDLLSPANRLTEVKVGSLGLDACGTLPPDAGKTFATAVFGFRAIGGTNGAKRRRCKMELFCDKLYFTAQTMYRTILTLVTDTSCFLEDLVSTVDQVVQFLEVICSVANKENQACLGAIFVTVDTFFLENVSVHRFLVDS